MTVETFDKIPDTVLKDITDKTAIPDTRENSNIGVVSDDEVLKAGNDVKQASNSMLSGSSPDSAKPVNSSVTPSGSTNKPMTVGSLVTGKFAVDIMDFLLPALTCWAVGKFGWDMDRKGLQLSTKEKETISEPMGEFLHSINIKIESPLAKLIVALSTIYGLKVYSQWSEIKPKQAKKTPVKNEPGEEVDTEKKALTMEERAMKIEKRRMAKNAFISELRASPSSRRQDMVAIRFNIAKTKAKEWLVKNKV